MIATIDFETEPIENRPNYPPKPLGVAIYVEDEEPYYLSWGHVENNNSSKEDASNVLNYLYTNYEILGHNIKFDLEVAHVHLNTPLIPPLGFHETQFLAFLHNPYTKKIGLKNLATDLIGMPPEERDALREWLFDNRPDLTKGKSRKTWDKAIEHAKDIPGDVVGRYAIGDVVRTFELFKYYVEHPIFNLGRMWDAYYREIKLLPLLLENEMLGIRINRTLLEKDIVLYEKCITTVENYIYSKIGKINLNSGPELAEALTRTGLIDELPLTPSGKQSTAKDTLVTYCKDTSVVSALLYLGTLNTYMSTFMKPWYLASELDNRIYTRWNQVKSMYGGEDLVGTGTGRLSSNPNVQNMPKPERIPKLEFVKTPDVNSKSTLQLPLSLKNKALPLPVLRSYIIPDEGYTLCGRDYSQQEFRIFAHFEDDVLLEAYKANPRIDFHDKATQIVNDHSGQTYSRWIIKQINLANLYSMGIGRLSEILKITYDEAKAILATFKKALPSVEYLKKLCYDIAKEGDFITTWGGRVYYCEPPGFHRKTKKEMTFEYKLINSLIQGSAADCTKEALINFGYATDRSRMLLNLHDEILIQAKTKFVKQEMLKLKVAMESVKFDVLMLSEGEYGTSFGEMTKEKEL